MIDLDILNLVCSWGLLIELGDSFNKICLNDSFAIQNHYLSMTNDWRERLSENNVLKFG